MNVGRDEAVDDALKVGAFFDQNVAARINV
jgi:hypothetical protein